MRKLTLFFASLFLCMGMAWAQAESVLAGEGTEANPYLIESVDDLVLFRNSVNAGEAKYNAKGVYVALGADIDLSDENWAPIGSDKNHEFKGIFDGREHTVSNLKIESADLEYAGLFGYANGATIKNVNVKNVDISAYAHVAAIAGIVYTGNVENCHVSGTINLVAKYAYSAGIAADGYVNVRNCSVIAEGTGVITVVEKTGAGGITGWRGEGNLVIENCTVKNLDITAWASLGSISGIIHYDNSVTGCTVENVKLTKTRENGQGSVGVVSGNWERKADGNYAITVTDNSFTNVEINGTAINNLNLLLGSNYTTYITIPEDNFVEENNTLTNVASNLKVVAKTYNDLKLALAYSKDGETVELGADIELGSQNAQEYFKPAYNRESYCGIVIPDDKAVTLDLNGKTVSYTDTYGDVDNVMILNLGNLTIDDSSTEKNGKLTYKAVAGTSTYSKFYSTIFNCGTLTINAGTVENTCETETDVTNAVDNHSRLSHEYGNDCVLTVNGGILSGAYYYAIRQYTHYLEGVQNRVVINGGDINGGVYMQHGDSWYYADPANNRLNVDCYLTIIGGNINLNTTPDAFGKIKSRLNNPDNNAFGLEIKGGNINVPVELLVQRGYYYTNGVSGATTPTEAAGTRNAEWLEKNGGFITGGTFAEMGSAEEPTMNVAAFVAEGYQLKANEDGTGEVIVEPALSGEGTEDNPYLINNIDDLILFRNSVNVGETKYNADGVYVALGADIDMAGIDWSVNIGDDCSATFDGIFDGQGHTIYNLTATETAKKADGYVCTGLFGAIYGNAVVKNFTIENVSINTGDFTGNNAAAVVGFAYSCAGSIENVTVTGDININAAGVTGVGAIVGYDYYSPSLVVKGCEVKGNDGSAIVGKSYVGGLVGYASSKIALNNNTVENIDVEGVGSVGAIAGIMLGGSSADANTVKNVAVSATGELWANSAAVVAGTITGGGVTVANTTVEDVTANGAEAALVGGVLVEKPTAPIAKVAAKIGDTYYTTLEAAFAADGLVESLLPIALTDSEEYVAYEENCLVGQLSYTRTLPAANVWMPLYVPFEIPVEVLGEDYEVATFHAYHETIDEYGYVVEGGAYVELVKIKGGTLYANRPYLIKAKNEAALEVNLELADAVLYGASSERLTVTCSSATHEFAFSGIYKESDRVALGYEEGKTACFAMIDGALAAMSDKAVLGAYRICMTSTVKPGIHYAATSAARAISLRVIGEESADGTTVIYDVENDAQAVDCIYDLQGRRIENPLKDGLYIINGKKVIF